LNSPLEETHQPDGRPAERQRRGTEKRNRMLPRYGARHPDRALQSRSYHQRVTREGNAIPRDRRQEARASTGRQTGRSSGWGRSGSMAASAANEPGSGRREPDGPTRRMERNSGAWQRNGLRPGKLEGRETSIKKADVVGPRPESRRRALRDRTKLKRPRRTAVFRKRSFNALRRRGGFGLLSFFARRIPPYTPSNRLQLPARNSAGWRRERQPEKSLGK